MAYRNTICTPHIIDLESEQNYSQLHPESYTYQGNASDMPNQNAQLVMAAATGNVANVELCDYRNRYDRTINDGSQYNYIQNGHAVINLDFSSALLPNYYNNRLLAPSSSRYFPVPQCFGTADMMPMSNQHYMLTRTDDGGRNDNFGESARESSKRKIPEVVAENYYSVNGLASSSSSSSYLAHNPGLPQWGTSCETNVALPDLTTLDLLEYQGGGTLQAIEGSSRGGRNRFSSMMIQQDSAPHGNYLFPANYLGQSFQPANHAWVAQTGSSVVDGASQWDHINAMTNLQSRLLSPGAMQMTNDGMHENQNSISRLNSGAYPHLHYLMQNVQAPCPINHTQMQGPYQHQFSNLQQGGLNPSTSGLRIGPNYPSFLSYAQQILRPRHTLQANSEVNPGSVRIFPPEHDAFMELSRFYEVGHVIDEHRDMRLDIDGMSYEELLALEERIGNVNTGLTEEFLLENLKTSLYVPGAASSLGNRLTKNIPQNDACIICQVEYETEERIGTLDCGHTYHADCIKQWLLLKNLCPICKTSGLSTRRKCG